MAEISSSAWWTKPPTSWKWAARKCETEVAGVIGYIEQTSIPAAIAPRATAWLPFITTIGSGRWRTGTSKRNGTFRSAQA